MNDLLFFLIGSALTLSVALAVRRLGNVDGASDWLLGWVSILVAGLYQMTDSGNAISLIAPVFDSLFAGFLLSGALRFVGKTEHLTPVWVGVLATAAVRCVVEPFVSFELGPFSATLFIGLASILSADQLHRYGQRAGLPATRTFSLVFLLPAFAQLNFAVLSKSQPDLTTAFFLWLMAGSLLIMVQLFLLIEKARFEAQVNREALATMAEAAPVGLCLTTPGGEIRASNPVAQRLLDSRNPTGLSLQALVVDRSNLTLYDLETADQGCVAQLNSGQSITISRAAITPGDKLVGYAWFFHQFMPAEPLPTHSAQSRHLQSLPEVAGSFAHVINNRLMVISGSAELIGMGAPDDCRAHLDRLALAVEQCAQTTAELLRIVERTLQPGSTRVGQAIEAVSREHSVNIEVMLGDTAGLELDVSETAFATAINELMENTIERGATSARIVSHRSREDGFVVITVSGSGNPDSDQTSRPDESSFGKEGFSIAAGIIESRGGDIQREENTNETRFRTLWPIIHPRDLARAEAP